NYISCSCRPDSY
ncbi:hypothetical protein pipiens_017654, partial [Culex pipiens pipiens]